MKNKNRELKYTFKNDILFKIFFVKNQQLLKRLVAVLLGISFKSISKLTVINAEIL